MDINFSRSRNQVLSLPDGNEIQYCSGPGHMAGLGTTQILREGILLEASLDRITKEFTKKVTILLRAEDLNNPPVGSDSEI